MRAVWTALRRHALRTAFSTSGVTLAVAVALTTLAVNEGARREALREVEKLGAADVVVRSRGTLTRADADLVAIRVAGIAAISPLIEMNASVSGPRANGHVDVIGVLPDYARIRGITLTEGRWLHARDERGASRVAVLGAALAREMFGYGAAIGQPIRIATEWFTVVGVGAGGGREVMVPLSAIARRPAALDPGQPIAAIWIEVRDSRRVKASASAIAGTLGERPVGYDVLVASDLLAARDRTQRVFTLTASAASALLFAIGAIGISGTMLTAVVERTAEIGLRRAVGARRRDVMTQFLLESSAIALCGGVCGIVIGLGLAAITARYSGWAAPVSLVSVAVVFALALAIGLVSGIYPARRASRIQPFAALMHE